MADLNSIGLSRRQVFLAGMLCLAPSAASGQGIRLNDEIVADPNSGAALYGFDAVAYFLEQEAVLGKPSIQFVHAGKVWYFHSQANRLAFEATPQPFIPAFGGHDPMGVAAGFAVAGHPETFLIAGNRLFLFRDGQSRQAFVADPARLDLAERNWPLVRRDMVP